LLLFLHRFYDFWQLHQKRNPLTRGSKPHPTGIHYEPFYKNLAAKTVIIITVYQKNISFPQYIVKIDASVKSILPPRFWGVGSATARANSRFLRRFSDF